MHIGLQIITIAVQIVIITFSAERFIYGATALSRRLKWPDFLSGVLFLALGTSLPELMVAIMASHNHHIMLALGGAVGSNIANVLLVLGVVSIISPIFITGLTRRQILLQSIVMSAVSLLVMLWILVTGKLSYLLGAILLCGCLSYIFLLRYQMLQSVAAAKVSDSQQNNSAPLAVQTQLISTKVVEQQIPVWQAIAYWLFGLLFLLWAAHSMVKSVMELGRMTGVSEFVLGLTVIALGTSLPELAASAISAWRGKPEMVLGNVIGSNCFNLLAVAAVPALFSPSKVSAVLRFRDLPIMLAVTLFVTFFLFWKRGASVKPSAALGISMGRVFGGGFLLLYCLYLFFVVMN